MDVHGATSAHLAVGSTVGPMPPFTMPADELLEAARPALAVVAGDPELVTIAGDFHGEANWARHVLKAAARAGSSVVIPAGDFGVWPRDAFLDTVEHWAARLGVVVLFVDGNHEDFDYLATFPVDERSGLRVVRPHVLHAPRGTRWVWRSLTWLALGGATSVDRARRTEGFDWFPQEALTTGQVYRAVADGPVDVMVTHDCPAGVDIPGLGTDRAWPAEAYVEAQAHRELLRAAVDEVRPTHLFHGHFHRRYSAELPLAGGLVCQVEGLDMNGSMTRGYLHLDLDILVAQSWAARA